MLDRWLGTAGAAVLVLVLLAAAPSARADDDGFTVSGVHEDVTAANALAARDQAQAEGQRQAFDTLMGRVAGGKVPRLSVAQITDLVVGFEVANERTSTVRYVADYTFHFNPNGVRRLMGDSGAATNGGAGGNGDAGAGSGASPAVYTPVAKPLLVLPVYSEGGHAVLWDDPNPWRDAWAQHGSQGAVPTVVPVGDLADVSTIDAPKAIAGDPAALKAIAGRYQNDDVLVVQGSFADGPRRFVATATRFSPRNPVAMAPVPIETAAKPGEGDVELMNRAVSDVMAQLGQAWKSANSIDTSASGIIGATVPSASLGDWVAVRNRLRGVPAIRSVELVSFDRNQLRISIRYIGDQTQLRGALHDRGLDLTGSDPDWTLAVQSAPPAAPPAGTAPVEPVNADSSEIPPPSSVRPGSSDSSPIDSDLEPLRKADQQP